MKTEKSGVAIAGVSKCVGHKKMIEELEATNDRLEIELASAIHDMRAAVHAQRVEGAKHARELRAALERAERIEAELATSNNEIFQLQKWVAVLLETGRDTAMVFEELREENLRLRGIDPDAEDDDEDDFDEEDDDPSPSVRMMRARADVANGMG